MAIYRQVYMKFWTDDSKVVDDFTPEDKYFFLYLMTNPHTTLTGCYEISNKVMARETGYNEETVKRLMDRMERIHNVIRYDQDTKEVLIINWHKYNWTSSDKVLKAVREQANLIKSETFKEYVLGLADGDTVSIPYAYRMDTSVPVTVTDTVSVTDKEIDKKHKYGEYGHVLLTDKELEKVKERYTNWEDLIRMLDEGIELKGYKYKNHYLALLKWAEKDGKAAKKEEKSYEERVKEWDELEKKWGWK